MFFWNYETDDITTSLSEELLNCGQVSKLQIATAFLSDSGIDMIRKMREQYRLGKDNIILYLSSNFNMGRPAGLLEQLSGLCATRIFFERTFHPKVYFFEGDSNTLIYGSANFTGGGLGENVEFGSVTQPSRDELASLNKFFAYCKTYSVPVDEAIIRFYREQEPEMSLINQTQKKLQKVLSNYLKQNDVFSADEHDLANCYFTYADYETFFARNSTLNNSQISKRREAVQKKILAIDDAVYPKINALGLWHHKDKHHITSVIYPAGFNHYKVSWMGSRYGKSEDEINITNEKYQFHKHANIQFSIRDDGLVIYLFLAVKHDAVDRANAHEKLNHLQPAIEREMIKLVGHSAKWVIYEAEQEKEISFALDDRDIKDFMTFFKENDKEGYESYLQLHYAPDDPRIATFDDICNEVVKKTTLLLPLYNVVAWRPRL